MQSNRRVVCAAIKNTSGNIVCSARHFDKLMIQQMGNNKASWVISEQGFIDQYGVFMTREEAWLVANEAGQIIRRCGGDDSKLYSENLY